jgi:hypothetical protein
VDLQIQQTLPEAIRLDIVLKRHPLSRHLSSATLVDLAVDPTGNPFSIYDAEDYARDSSDDVVKSISDGVTIYTIGLGDAINGVGTSDDFYPDGVTKIPAAKNLLEYIATSAGEPLGFDPATDTPIYNHGQYFFAPNGAALSDIFELIANNIATRISQ